jgi:hypothetical protein
LITAHCEEFGQIFGRLLSFSLPVGIDAKGVLTIHFDSFGCCGRTVLPDILANGASADKRLSASS